MSFIAEPADTKPRGQVRQEESAITWAECPNMEIAWIVAEALNLRERKLQVEQQMSDRTMEP